MESYDINVTSLVNTINEQIAVGEDDMSKNYEIKRIRVFFSMDCIKQIADALLWFYLTSFFVTIFFSKSLWASKLLKIHIRGCI